MVERGYVVRTEERVSNFNMRPVNTQQRSNFGDSQVESRPSKNFVCKRENFILNIR